MIWNYFMRYAINSLDLRSIYKRLNQLVRHEIVKHQINSLDLKLILKTGSQFLTPSGGRLGIPTDRDQRIWVFQNNPKNILLPKENPKKYFPKSETLKSTLLKHNSLSES